MYHHIHTSKLQNGSILLLSYQSSPLFPSCIVCPAGINLVHNLRINIPWQVNAQLRIKQLRQVRPIPQVDPLPIGEFPRLSLLMHTVALDDPVITLGPGERR